MKKLILPNSSCKALTHWGTNPGSTIGLRMSTQQRNMVGIPPLLSDILIGLLLSDGCLQIQRKGRNAQFEFNQGTIHMNFA
jgi:hypothetical protein